MGGIVSYNSVYFRPLDEKLAEQEEVAFDAKSLVERIWESELLEVYNSAMDLDQLIHQLNTAPEQTFENQGNALGIGNIGYFKVKGEGVVQSVNENNVLLQVSDQTVEIETEFIYGNAVRDASGLIKVNDFESTSDFNLISELINDKVRNDVIPDFKKSVANGAKVQFMGAIELNKAHLDLSRPEVIPVSVQIIP